MSLSPDKKQPHKFQGSVLYLQPEGLVDQTGNMVMPRDEILAALSAARSAIGEHEALSALKLAVHQELGDRPSDEFPKITAAMMAHDLIVIRAPRSHELPPLKTTARDLVAKPSATLTYCPDCELNLRCPSCGKDASKLAPTDGSTAK